MNLRLRSSSCHVFEGRTLMATRPSQPSVRGPIHLTHASRPNGAEDLVRSDERSRFQKHEGVNPVVGNGLHSLTNRELEPHVPYTGRLYKTVKKTIGYVRVSVLAAGLVFGQTQGGT